ncbi:hypothetical protein AAT1_02022 [Pseudomonas phage AAT-1]|uniref:Tail assembly chaperone n=2 Tax=Pamexvirus TaxID=1982355 RepID=A0A125SA51_9CAUD|nr:hypothetical protein P9A56_gp22 [Pseudomonas phage AAT-1]YP_010739402.1 tail assembly chaperone [Pseudomonas phage phiH1]AME18047.1 hypothetical protein AAT1_02022 [Pseudomonas phage AAT-1]UYD21602.1 tail assembly chaperone [Pseudomonas phage phiH1]WGH15487.1 hypothetical protein [Pseudomonas phage PA_LZ02]
MTDNDNKAAGAVTGMDAFFTRSRANEGLELPLYLPNGQKSEHWVRILGVDSDSFRNAEAESRRDAFRIAQIEDLTDRAKAIADSKRRLVASLVVAWSFDRPCNVDEVEAFFREAPQIMDAIDLAASKRALFFGAGSSSSRPTPSTSSSST